MKIYLVGYRCTGKTTIGRKLASRYRISFFDTDLWVEKQAGMRIARIVESIGWDHFRQLEKQALAETIDLDQVVVSTGGGIVLDPGNRSILQDNGIIVWLTAGEQVIIKRINSDPETQGMRPPLGNLDLVAETRTALKTRIPLYAQSADLTIDTGVHDPDVCVNMIDRSIKDVGI